MMISTGLPALNEPGNSEAREPKGHEVGLRIFGVLFGLIGLDHLHQTFRGDEAVGTTGIQDGGHDVAHERRAMYALAPRMYRPS